MKIVALVGQNYVGKTTIASDIITRGRKVIKLSFADAVRDEITELYNIPSSVFMFTHNIGLFPKLVINWIARTGEEIDYTRYKEQITVQFADLGLSEAQRELISILWKRHNISAFRENVDQIEVTLRDLLVIHGTDIRRNQDKDYWVKRFDEKIRRLKHIDMVIIDDTRFPNEFEWIDTLTDKLVLHLVNKDTRDYTDKVEQLAMEYINSYDYEQINVQIPISNSCCKTVYDRITEEYP